MSSQTIIEGFDPAGPFAGLILPDRFRKRQSETRFKQEWKLSAPQYAVMMSERFNLRAKKWQRGSIILAAFGLNLGPFGVVSLTAHAVTDFDPGVSATSGYRFGSNGELHERDGGGHPVQFPAEWWSEEPDVGIGAGYETRPLSAGATGAYTVFASADDIWITLDANRTWYVVNSVGGISVVIRTFELGDDGAESADASAVLTCTANNLP